MRRARPPAPKAKKTLGHCSICPSLDGVDVIEVTHKEAPVAPGTTTKMWYAFCLRCVRLMAKAAA